MLVTSLQEEVRTVVQHYRDPIQVLASDGSHVPYTISTSTPGINIAGETGVTQGSFTASANGNFLDHAPQTIPVALEVGTSNPAFTNPAFLNTTNGLFTDLLYFTILGRDPDPGGFNFWLNVANSGGPGVYFLPTAGTPSLVRLQMEGTGTPNQGFMGSPDFLGLFK